MTATDVLATPRLAQALERILQREGGYARDPADRGGETHWGITAAFARDLGHQPSEIASLTRDQARQWYADWIARSGLWQIDDPRLLEAVLDDAVHSGTGTAIRTLQRALGVAADGRIGPQTRAALAAADPEVIRERVLAARLVRLGRLLQQPGQARFAAGWLRRVADILVWRPHGD